MKDRTSFVQDVSACHYERLGVSPGVDAETLRQAFRSRSKALHPDTTVLPKDEARQAFQKLKESFDEETIQQFCAYLRVKSKHIHPMMTAEW
mgnify:CR=1 FL=1